jgi:hypothetical protein
MSKSKIKENDVQILRSAVLFGLTRHAWSNRSKVGNDRLKTDEVDSLGITVPTKTNGRVNATKRLIVCPAYDNVMEHLNKAYNWCLDRSMMATGISRGCYFVRRDMVEEFETKLEDFRKQLRETFVPDFIAAYPEAKRAANTDVQNGGLGSLYNEDDYPTEDELRESFGIDHTWFALSVPDELPAEIRSRENQKLKDTFAKAQEEVLYALREGFAGLVDHAVERLKVLPGEKPKIFVADSMVNGFMDFFDTFRAKNLMDDAELEDVVGKAQDIVAQFAPNIKAVKNSTSLRNGIAEKLSEVRTTLDGMLKDRPSRKFQFD